VSSVFCPKCGQPRPAGTAFCSRCGFAFEPPRVPPSVESSVPVAGPLTARRAIAGVVVLVLVVAAFSALGKPGATTPAQAAPQAPIHMQGSGMMNTGPFNLDGGDHTVTWTATDTGSSSVGCYHGAFIRPTSGGGADLLANEMLDGGQTKSGATHLYNVAAGSYYIDVSSGCGWQFDISR
jgi:hypothetical protein